LSALTPTGDPAEMLLRGEAWMFDGDLHAQEAGLAATFEAEERGLSLFAAAVPDSPDLAAALVSHANTYAQQKKPGPALELTRHAQAICDAHFGPGTRRTSCCLEAWHSSMTRPATATAPAAVRRRKP
jgi:hypothetical protein